MNIKNKKQTLVIMIFVFFFSANISFFVPRKAHAQFTDPVQSVLQAGKWVWERVSGATTYLWNKGGSVAFMRAFQSFSNQLAYKAATQIATGDAGGKPQWFTKLIVDEARLAGEAAGAEFLDNLASGYGINICQPPTMDLPINLALSLKLNLKDTDVASMKPRCSLDELKKKWGDFATQLTNPLSIISLNDSSLMDVLKTTGYDLSKFGIPTSSIVNSKLTPDQRRQLQAELLKDTISFQKSDTNFVQDAVQAAKDAVKKADADTVANITAGDSPKGKRSLITKSLIVPAELTKQELINIQKRNEDAAKLRTEDILVDSANIFLNTLVSKGLNTLIQNLMKEKAPQADLADGSGSFVGSKTGIIDEIFSTINRISMNINPRDINLIAEMEMDMGDEFMGKMNNKTIDSKFADVLRRAETEPLTTKEAIDENLLDGNKFIGYIDIGTSIRQPMLDEGYSYDNIKKLRKNRVVPVGWEFAALKVAKLNPDNYPAGCDSRGCKLVSVMEGYDKTGTFKRGNETIKDNYCGYRSVSLAPYNINITSAANCNAAGMLGVDASTIDVKWVGTGNAQGYCMKYNIDSEGVVVSKEIETAVALNNETTCNNSYEETFYHEWIYGGCVVKEKDESPFCRLVDPNWVLKAPKQQCASEGYYSALESAESPNRYKDCADVKNCLKEDDNGNCLGYGYCLKEKNIWKFRGRKCDEKSAGCVALKDDAGKEKSYILDTLKSCPPDEAGCKEYSKYKTKNAEGNYVWATTDFNYFNKNVLSCDKGNEGCSKFIEIIPGLNLVPNPSFEIDENEDMIPDGWDAPNFMTTTTEAFDGRYSILHTKGDSILKLDISNSDFNILNKGLYTLSYRVKKLRSSDVVSVTPSLILNGESITNTDANYSSGESQWEMKSGYFGVNGNSSGASIKFAVSGDVYIDAVQFELNNYDASNVSSGVGVPSMYNNYGEKGILHMKKAPSYYNCNSANPDVSCANYSKYCSKDDLGCEAYKPENGDQIVSGIVSQEDICPSECNNYQTFSQYPSYFEILESNSGIVGLENKDFISGSAKDCSPSQESCELFTNVDKANKGGEAREYYSYLRQCVKPSAVSSTIYYTWEGSDTSGFQLKTWRFLKSNKSEAPCTNVEIGATSTCSDIGLADVEGEGQCDPNTNLDCRTFYDKDAQPHNRLLSKTIPVTDSCIDLRREASDGSSVVYRAVPSMSTKCSATSVGCRRYKGNNGNNIRSVLFEDFEPSGVFLGEVFGGSKAPSNESTVYNGHSMVVYSSSGNTVSIEYNLTQNGETLIPGKRYTLDFWAKSSNDNNPNNNNHDTAQQKTKPAIEFLNLNPIKLFKAHALNVNNLDFGLMQLENNQEWLQYKYNWRDLETSASGDYILKFSITLPDDYKTFFIDNISLKEITSDFYKIKDSWVTPATCRGYLGCQKYSDRDNNPWYFHQFTNTCNEKNVGCSAMIDTQNSEMPFQQTYNAYCSNSSGGECSNGRTYYKNYSNINSGNFSSSTIVVSKDRLVYIIKERNNLCASSNKGCSAFGFKGDDGKYQDVYKINNPDNYIQDDYFGSSNKILCLSEFRDCSAFSVSGGGTIYKIHPRDKVCEYKEADASNGRAAGYYNVNDANISCEGSIYNENYNLLLSDISYIDSGIAPFGGYNNDYSVSCNSNQNKCSMFIDPTDSKDLSIEATNATHQQINFTNSGSWSSANWQNGQFENVSNLLASSVNNVLSFNISDKNTIIYKASKSNPFGFSVSENAVYRLSANVEFDGLTTDGKEYISTFLSCGPRGQDGAISYVEDSVVGGENNNPKGGVISGSIPYAFPFTKANYFIQESDNKSHQISGLYKILPGANYCNVAFYVKGKSGAVVKLKDIRFEKMEGNYYYIDNEELDKTSCSKASVKDGCVLFNNLSKSNLSSNALRSYENGSLVGINSNDPSYNNDSNELLKVVRDRECGEWDTCSSKIKTVDTEGQDKYSCVSLIGCNNLSSSGDCANYIPKNQNDKALNLEKYYSDLGSGSWSNMIYSGYSMPGAYAPHSLSTYKTTSSSMSTYNLGHIIKRGQYLYKDGISYTNPLSSIADTAGIINISSLKSCRLYPEKDSPFSWTPNNSMVLNYELNGAGSKYAIITGKDSAFANANISQPSYGALKPGESNVLNQGQSSDCSYRSVNYGMETLFYPYEGIDIPNTIETSNDGITTSTMKIKKIAKNMGWFGFCLDYDKSRFINTGYKTSYNDPSNLNYRCLSWYPVDAISGEVDSTSYAPQADIVSKLTEGATMCIVGNNYKTTEDRIYCLQTDASNQCIKLVLVPNDSMISANNIGSNTYWLTNYKTRSELNFDVQGQASIIVKDNALGGMFSGDQFGLTANANLSDSFDDIFVGSVSMPMLIYAYDIEFSNSTNIYLESCNGDWPDTPVCPTDTHQISYREWEGDHCGWTNMGHTRRMKSLSCNPRTYGYYINDSGVNPMPSRTGKCGKDCKYDPIESGDFSFGRGCLRNSSSTSVYATLVNQFGGQNTNPSGPRSFNVGLCKSQTPNEFDTSCDIVAHFEIINQLDNISHSCSIYRDPYSSTGIASYIYPSLESEIVRCFGNDINNYQDPRSPLLYNNVADCRSAEIPYSACRNIDGTRKCENRKNGCCPDGCQKNRMLPNSNNPNPLFDQDCLRFGNSDCNTCSIFNQSGTQSMLTSCANDKCLKSCKTSAILDGSVKFKANNFYLNTISIEKFTTATLPAIAIDGWREFCKDPLASDIFCPSMLSGSSSSYGISGFARNNKMILQVGPTNSASWVANSLHPSFGAAVGTSQDPIFVSGGFSSVFPGYYGNDIAQAKTNLGQLIVGIPNSNLKTFNGVEWLQDNSINWNVVGGENPVIRSVKSVSDGGGEGNEGFSINRNPAKDYVVVGKNNTNIDISFYAYAVPNQTPIREIKICWDSNSENGDCFTVAGPFKNRKPDCIRRCGVTYKQAFPSTSANTWGAECGENVLCPSGMQCFAKTWGDHEDACKEDIGDEKSYLTFSHLYSCSPMSDTWLDNCGNGRGCCKYTPYLQITDSWGKSKGTYMCGADTCSIKIYPQ